MNRRTDRQRHTLMFTTSLSECMFGAAKLPRHLRGNLVRSRHRIFPEDAMARYRPADAFRRRGTWDRWDTGPFVTAVPPADHADADELCRVDGKNQPPRRRPDLRVLKIAWTRSLRAARHVITGEQIFMNAIAELHARGSKQP